jgi:hypothetical protein
MPLVQVKNDKLGIGSNNDYSDTWLDTQDDFSSLLASLNSCHSGPGSGTATPTSQVPYAWEVVVELCCCQP